MTQRCSFRYSCVLSLIAMLAPQAAFAQTATYHLHGEASQTAGVFQMRTAAPDAASTAINLDLKKSPIGVFAIKDFNTSAGVPNLAGVIPAGSTVSMVLWMRKTANAGVMYPRGKLTLNSPTGAALCEASGTTALTTTLAAAAMNCVTATSVTMSATDRFYLSVAVQVASSPGNTNVKAEFRIEGVLNGNHDSRITTPLPVVPPQPPAISSITPTSGPVGADVSIVGSNFGATRGASQVLFAGVSAAVTTWSANSITATVPSGASTGNVTVTVQGMASNGVPFTVVTAQDVAGPLNYVYDALGRLVQMTSASGQTAIYRYDAVGNIHAVERPGVDGGGGGGSAIAISSFSPTQGSVGTAVTIAGAGFSSTSTDNIVSFNGTSATVTSASPNELAVVVPAGATTGPISVTGPSGTVTSGSAFTVLTAAGAPTITGFSPAIGVTGTPFTISGTNFEPTPANDRLTLNIRTADAMAATATTLNTAVPLASMGGRITVSTPSGTAISDGDFVVAPSPYTPADVESSQRLAPGESGTVTINTSGHIGLLLFDGIAGMKVSVVATSNTWTACPAVRPYYISIYAPDASLVKTIGNGCGTVTLMDQERLPLTGTYTLMVDPTGTNVGAAAVTVHTFDDITGTITADGTPVPISITTPAQNARFTFSGTQGQVISGLVTNATIPGSCAVYAFYLALVRPDGSTQATVPSCGGSLFMDRQTLATTGTYTLVLDPVGTSVGNATVALYTVVDVTGPISNGVGVPVTLTTPGQNARFTFSGTPGQVVSGLVTNATIPGSCAVYAFYLALVRPDGSTQATIPSCGGSVFLDRQTLTAAGTYTLVLDPVGTGTGNGTVTLYNVVDVTGPIANATAMPVTLTTPGQNALFTFSGTAGQVVTGQVWGATIPGSCASYAFYLKLLRPDGSAQAAVPSCGGGVFLDRQTLSSTGTYTVMLDPIGAGTGAANVAFYFVTDITGTITPNGPAVPVSITTPGQNAQLTFSGTALQLVSAFTSNNTIPGSCFSYGFSLTLLKPDGSTLGSISSCGGDVLLSQRTLPVTGIYTLVLNPADSRTGSLAITLTSP